jgi:hypothetical protein
MNSLRLEKSTETGLYVKNLPQRGCGSCCSGSCNRNCNSGLSCYRSRICFAVICHFDFSKVQFFIKLQNLFFCFYEYFSKHSSKKRILNILPSKSCFLILVCGILTPQTAKLNGQYTLYKYRSTFA